MGALKKILFIPVWYPIGNLTLDGVFVREHAKAISKLYHVKVFHIAASTEKAKMFSFVEVVEDGIAVYRIYFFKFSRLLLPLTFLAYLIAGFIGLFKVVKRFGKPDLCHQHVLTRTGIFCLALKFLYGTPYVITEHWSRYLPIRNTYKGWLRKWFTGYVVKRSSGISAVTADLKKAMIANKLNHPNFKVISNTVNGRRFNFKGYKESSTCFNFLHVSTLGETVKNPRGILRAAKKLLEITSGFSLTLVGDGGNNVDLETYKDNLGLKNHVFFLGELKGDFLLDIYLKADSFVLFSNFENQPCVVLEALCCGLPVIATAVGGIPEIINKENGYLISSKSEDELTSTMLKVMKEFESFTKSTISKKAVEIYGYDAISKDFISFYEEAGISI